jgi:hypothetical protein
MMKKTMLLAAVFCLGFSGRPSAAELSASDQKTLREHGVDFAEPFYRDTLPEEWNCVHYLLNNPDPSGKNIDDLEHAVWKYFSDVVIRQTRHENTPAKCPRR